MNPSDQEPSLNPASSASETTSASPVHRVEPTRRTSWKPLALIFGISGLFFVLFVVGSFVFFRKGMDGAGKSAARSIFREQGVGVLKIKGVIMNSEKALKAIESFKENPEVKALVVRIDSPGGAVAPSQEIYDAIKAFPKPKVASMGSVAASGGYYIAVATDRIFANAGTITGSIGVIMEFANLEKLYEWAKVKRFSIKTGKFKDAGAEYREMQPEERGLLQGMVDDVLLQFKTAVAEGRKLSLDEVTPLADGRIFSGSQAKTARLVDELGGIDAAIEAAAKLGNITGKPRIIHEEKKRRGFLELIEDQMGSEDSEGGEARGSNRLISALQQAVGLDRVRSLIEPGIYWIWKGAL